MPKVNEDYINKKKTQILDAAFRMFQQKPLYEITMLDVIKEAGISKGGIYRYFSDIDEVIIALINRETAQNNYKHKIDEILASKDTTEGIIEALFTFLGNYINDSSTTLGKFQFELTVYLSNHPEKAEKFKSLLTEQENGQYLVDALFNKIMEGVNKGEFEVSFPLKDIFTYIIATIDGVVNKVVLQKCYGTNGDSIDVIKIFKIISNSVLHMLAMK
ncbi:AcrR family transcriptional regulator [Clostridium tetanomorphum]|uniref:TetR/AcrR family transcriptional regulator n=1 Tax=Clostridium tetanomorphum TaxID=1553 RepID=UPI0004533B7C|nr:TetR/AcrR family transcriptional regulator [Clostridium tetanomorphum]KAJ50160.1 TetR family transcriptional regulator [Clostridium tetanomorphum DSM 665]MBP1864274.1 AcrR family transcriptional regulator [Clostridium tetanomorphum]NRS83721.1 AcrR family transcriptional regulator [Clostridium tetanomorphum]SQC02129.1 TetR family transcriptional regulator [Clostridium tetanomorphum]